MEGSPFGKVLFGDMPPEVVFFFLLGFFEHAYMRIQKNGKFQRFKKPLIIIFILFMLPFGFIGLFELAKNYMSKDLIGSMSGPILPLLRMLWYFYLILIVPFLFIFHFKEDFFPEIDEGTLLFYTVLFWPVFLDEGYLWWLFNLDHLTLNTLLAQAVPFLSFVASCVVVLSSFTYMPIGKPLKIFLYLWFVVILLVLASFQIEYFSDSLTGRGYSVVLASFSFGAIIFSFLAYVSYFFYLLPPLIWRSSPRSGAYISDSVDFMFRRFSGDQVKVSRSVQILLVVGGSFILNGFFRIVSLYVMVSFWLMVPILGSMLKKSDAECAKVGTREDACS